MSERRKRAQEAKVFLGEAGELRRVAAIAEVFPENDSCDPAVADWVVESLDSTGDGGIYTTVFSGPFAEERAVEYAREKYAGVRLR